MFQQQPFETIKYKFILYFKHETYPTLANSNRPAQRSSRIERSRRDAGEVRSGSFANQASASSRAISKIRLSRTMLATRKSGRPDCRVPRNSPGPRNIRSASAILKPSFVSTITRKRRIDSSAGLYCANKKQKD